MADFFETARAGTPFASTVFEALEKSDQDRPDIGITLLSEKGGVPPEARSYAEILSGARRRASQLDKEGVGQGDRVILVLPTGFDFVETFFSLQMLGAVPVPTYPPMSLQQAAVGLERQVRVEGSVRRLSDAESDAYWVTRPPGSQLVIPVREGYLPAMMLARVGLQT